MSRLLSEVHAEVQPVCPGSNVAKRDIQGLATRCSSLNVALGGVQGQANFSFSVLEGGVPRGALTELSGAPGSGKTALALRLLAENPVARAAWIEPRLTIYPPAFPQQEVALSRVLFVEGGQHWAWAAQQALASSLFEVVVASLGSAPATDLELRRLQLSAEKAQAAMVLLRDQPTRESTWMIRLQLSVLRDGRAARKPTARLIKERRRLWSVQ